MTADVQGFAFDRAVERLSDRALMDVQQADLTSAPRYTLHPLVRAFAGAKLAEQPEFEEKARARWSAYFLDFLTRHVVREQPKERYWNALASIGLVKIDPEWANIQHVLDWADQRERHELLIELMMRLAHYMDRRGLYTDRIYYARKAAEATDKLGQQRVAALLRDEALLRIDTLGHTLIEEGCFEEAEQEIRIGLDRVQALDAESPDARDLRALAQAFLARSNLHRGDLAKALAWSHQSPPVGCRTVIRHRVTMARGEIAQATNDYATAIALFKETVRLEEEYGGEEAVRDELSQPLGFAYLAQGDLEMAKAAFNEVLALKERAGTLEAIWGKYGLACVAKAEGDRCGAYLLAHEALDALTRLRIRHKLHQRIRELLESLGTETAATTDTT